MTVLGDLGFIGAACGAGLILISLFSAAKAVPETHFYQRVVALVFALSPLWISLVVLFGTIVVVASDGAVSGIETVMSLGAFFVTVVIGYLIFGLAVRKVGVLGRLEGVARRIRLANVGEA